MWHFSNIFWRYGHFCCKSLVLEVIPHLWFIGSMRRDWRFEWLWQLKFSDFLGGSLKGLCGPQGPQIYSYELYITSYNGDMKIFFKKDLPNQSCISLILPKSPNWQFWLKSPKRQMFWFQHLHMTNTHLTIYITRSFWIINLRAHNQKLKSPQILLFWCTDRRFAAPNTNGS